MSTDSAHGPAIRAFAADVRAALGDLPAEDIDELTDDLEADLSEQAAEGADRFTLGDPVAYAAELRSAAGLPERWVAEAEPRWSIRRLARWASGVRADANRDIRSSPAASAVLDFLVSLRPFWWILRAWAVYQVFSMLFFSSRGFGVLPSSAGQWLVLLVFVVLSAQWGRGKWLPWRWLRPAMIVVSVASVLVLPGLVTAAAASTGTVDDYAEAPATEVGYVEGLQLDGEPVSNIFAYDAAGNALSDVQLFDQNGNEIITVNYADMGGVRELYDNNSGQLYYLVPNAGVTNGVGWNVFPLRTADKEDLTFSNSSNILSTGEAAVTSPAIPPFRTVQPLIEQPEPGTTPTGEPTDAPDPAAVTDPAAPGTTEPGTTAPDSTEPGSPEPDPASPEPSVAPEATPSQ